MSEHIKKFLRRDLLLILILTIVLLGTIAVLFVIDTQHGTVGTWASQFYSLILRQ